VDGQSAPGRERVLDLTKSFALLVVVVAHALAWDLSTGEPASVLDLRPDLGWVTWLLQVLPLFFAAGAVTNAASWLRRPVADDFWRRRIGRLATPAVVYASVFTALLLPLALTVEQVEPVGRYLSQLLWFLGTYSAIVLAVPLTSRWTAHPTRTLALGLAVVVVVDLLRWQVAPMLGWANMLLVWGWLHQLGYSLPALRAARRARLLAGALGAFTLALTLALVGPYSTSMVSTAGDPKLSNLAPPTVVLALYGLAQVLLLAAVWPALERLMRRPRAWLVVAAFGSRSVDVYLWHIPLVGSVVALAWVAGWGPEPLGATWWALHLAVVAAVVPLAWLVAGPVGRLSARLARAVDGRAPRRGRALRPAMVVPVAVLALSQTGVATWWGPGLLGIPMSSLLVTPALVAAWWAVRTSRRSVGVDADDSGGLPRLDAPELPGRHTSVGQ
jgi:peptidoglycan/LPS O-acetylase OafA/YrhL